MTASTNSLYPSLRDNTALRLLQNFGFQAAIEVKSGEVFDEVTGTITIPATWYVFPCNAVYGGGGSSGGVTKDTDPSSLKRRTRKEVFLDASVLTIQPNPDDLFQDENGDTFEILSVDPINPGGVTVLWKLKVRK